MSKGFLKSISGLKSGHLEFAVSHPYRDEYPLRERPVISLEENVNYPMPKGRGFLLLTFRRATEEQK